jgi:hypothetical protein
MTENDLIELGFTKIEYTKEDLEELGDSSEPYRYYTYEVYRDEDDLPEENLYVLETQASYEMTTKEINGDGWYVELFDSDLFRWYKKEDVSILKMLLNDGLLTAEKHS